ncbi:MAG TPA: hydrolase [Burkholderiaceae bacterium]|nr:hydrolase [Burkholderiaceae bacterium]
MTLVEPYRAPRWLRLGFAAGHMQTILPALISRRPFVRYRRERWDTPPSELGDDFIDVDFVDATDEHTPLVVMFHGLEGSSHSHYACALMHAVQTRGWAGAVPHFRGCSGEPNRTARAYHSGDTQEIDWIIDRFARRYPQRPIYACGISLGGNALAKWLGEYLDAARRVRRAAIVSAPLDLRAGGRALSSGFNMVYTRMFLRTLKEKAIAKAQRHAELAHLSARAHEIIAARDLYAYDNLYTAPVHGFRDTDDYWTRASAKPWLAHIQVPTLVLNARNDPFMPADALPRAFEVSPSVVLEQPEEGGHVGFATGGFPGRLDWLPTRLLQFFADDARDG